MKNNDNINDFENFENGEFSNNEKFKVPENYFESFMDRLNKKIEQEELSEFKILSGIEKKNVFEAPQNYFENLNIVYDETKELENFKTLAQLNKISFVEPSETYFNEFEERLELKIELAQYQNLSVIEKQNCFAVEDEYFNSFYERLSAKVSDTKVVSLFGRIKSLSFTQQLAYAASIALVLGLGIYFSSQKTVTDTNCNQIACLDKKDIINSNEFKQLDEDALFELVDVKALSDSLQLNNKVSNDKAEELLDEINEENIVDEL